MEQPALQPSEVEAKYRVISRQIFADLLSVSQLGPFTLVPAAMPEDQINWYFDTEARDLHHIQYGFRVRGVQGQYTATLKGPATAFGSAQRRSEWEQPIPSADPATLPPGVLRDHLFAITHGASLHPLLSIRTQRQIINAYLDERHALELALDDIVIKAGDRTQASLELEIELLSAGMPSDLESMATLLVPRYHLVPEPHSKLARGLELLETNE